MYAEPDTVELAPGVAVAAAVATARADTSARARPPGSVIGCPAQDPRLDRLDDVFGQLGLVERHARGAVVERGLGAELDDDPAPRGVTGLDAVHGRVLARRHADDLGVGLARLECHRRSGRRVGLVAERAGAAGVEDLLLELGEGP